MALALGYSAYTPDWLQGMYDGGNQHEEECLTVMAADGWKVVHSYPPLAVDECQIYGELTFSTGSVTTHLDGVVLESSVIGNDSNLEIKSPSSWAKWERAHKTNDYSDPLMNRYAWQISVGMALTGLEAYVACLDEGRVRTFGIEVPPHSLAEIEARVAELDSWVSRGELPPVCSQDDGAGCPVAYLHTEPEHAVDAHLDRLVGDWAFDGDMVKEWEGKQDRAKKMLDEYLAGRDGLETDSSKVTRFTTTRTTYDTKAAMDDGLDLSKYEKTTQTPGIRITKKGE